MVKRDSDSDSDTMAYGRNIKIQLFLEGDTEESVESSSSLRLVHETVQTGLPS
jgi:hypothetical protein